METPRKVSTMLNIPNLIDMIKDKVVHFDYYRDGELWYKTECGFSFPVPIDDTGTGIFLSQDKAILFMRYMRKHIDKLKKAMEEQAAQA